MSKLIVEMEMPRNCDECEVNYDCAFCGITGSAFYGNTQMPNFMPDEQKLPDCPIVCVLPDEHGDLIDRDKLKRAFCNHCDGRDTMAVPIEQIEAFIDWLERNGYTLLKKAIIKALHDYRADGERRTDADRESTRD